MSRDVAEEMPPRSRTARALGVFTAAICRHPRAVLIVCVAATVASVVISAVSLRYRTQRDDLMSADRDVQQRWRAYVNEFGPEDDVVIAVEGDDPARMEAAIERLARGVRDHPDLFDRLFYKADLTPMADRALLYLPAERLREVRDRLDEMNVLFGPVAPFAWRSLTLENMLMRAEWCAEQLAEGQDLVSADSQLLEQLRPVADSAAATLADPDGYTDPWAGLVPGMPDHSPGLDGPAYFFSDDRTLAFLLLRPRDCAADSFTPARQAVAVLRDIVASAEQDFPELRFGLTGLPVLENDEMAASQSDSRRAGWFALAGVTLLYFFAYRRRRYPLLTIATLVTGTLWALGWLTLTVGHLNILSAAFAVMLIGMGDYGILWVARYEAERPATTDPSVAIRRTAEHVGPGILTAALTTALAFFATMLADFQAVAELGWIAGCGILLCALSCFVMMPAMLTLCDRRLCRNMPDLIRLEDCREVRRKWLPGLCERPRWVVAAACLVTLGLGASALRTDYDPNLLNLQDSELPSVAWEVKLIERTSGANWSAVGLADSPEEARRLREQFDRLPQVSRTVEVASLIPEDQDAKIPLLADIHHRLRTVPRPEDVAEHAPPDPASLRRQLARLVEKLRPLPAGTVPEGLEPALAGLSDRLDGDPAEVVARLSAFESRLGSDLAAGLHRLRDASVPMPIDADDLPDGFGERYVSPGGKWLVRAFARDSLWEFDALSEFVEATLAVDPHVTGKPFGTLEGLRSMRSGFEWAGVYALIAILGVLALDFRRAPHVTLALLPLAIGAVCCVGLMGLLGLPFNPANLIALPLIVGVGVDHGVHVLHDYRRRAPGERFALSFSTGRGILIAALTTMIGFAALSMSSHRGLAGLGFTLTIGVGCCLAAALVVLPALLRMASERRGSVARSDSYRRAA